jgi:hypothetical protein
MREILVLCAILYVISQVIQALWFKMKIKKITKKSESSESCKLSLKEAFSVKGYTIAESDNGELQVFLKKKFNIGLAFMLTVLMVIPMVLYVLYYFLIKKDDKRVYDFSTGQVRIIKSI